MMDAMAETIRARIAFGPRSRGLRSALAAAALATTLAGCAAAGAAPSTRSPAPASPVQPASRVALGCSDLVSTSDLGHLFADRMQAVNPAGPQLATGSGIPATYYVQNAGGIDCSWSNGKADDGSATIQAMTATMTVLPDAAADWARYRKAYHLTADNQAFCSGDTSTASCFLQALVGGYWVTADLENVDVKLTSSRSPVVGVVKPVFAAALARLAALPASGGGTGTAPGGAAGLPASCDGYVTPVQAKRALGTAATITFGETDPTWSLPAAAQQRSGVPFCALTPAGSDDSYGYIAALPSGSWAAVDALTLTRAKRLAVAGLGHGDSATAYINPTTNAVVVDLVIRGSWIEVDIVQLDSGAAIPKATVAPASSAIRIARDILVRVG